MGLRRDIQVGSVSVLNGHAYMFWIEDSEVLLEWWPYGVSGAHQCVWCVSDRRAVRVAMREDLFTPDPKRSEKVNAVLKSLISSCHVSWEKSPTQYATLTK